LAQGFVIVYSSLVAYCISLAMLISAGYKEDTKVSRNTEVAESERLDVDGLPKWRTEHRKLQAQTEKQKEVCTILHHAAATDDTWTLTKMIKGSFVNPNWRDHKGWTPLMRAAKCGCDAAVERLCLLKADLDTTTAQGHSPLHKAAKQGHTAVAWLLIEFKAKIDITNDGGATPLMIAVMNQSAQEKCFCGHVWESTEVVCKKCNKAKCDRNVVKVLLKANANVNLKKDVGYTALMLAARRGSMDLCRAILSQCDDDGQRSVKIDSKDKQGETALAKAHKKGAEDVKELLISHGADKKKCGMDISHKSHGEKSGHHSHSQHGHKSHGAHGSHKDHKGSKEKISSGSGGYPDKHHDKKVGG